VTILVGFEVPSRRQPLLKLLAALVALDRQEIRMYRNIPWLYKSGVRYKREPKIPGRTEQWQTITQLIRSGSGDCEDLAAARSAEIQERKGIKAIPWLLKKGNVWHVVVRYPDGTLEDPSARLGMKKPKRSY
jgi:hypothetical protein